MTGIILHQEIQVSTCSVRKYYFISQRIFGLHFHNILYPLIDGNPEIQQLPGISILVIIRLYQLILAIFSDLVRLCLKLSFCKSL